MQHASRASSGAPSVAISKDSPKMHEYEGAPPAQSAPADVTRVRSSTSPELGAAAGAAASLELEGRGGAHSDENGERRAPSHASFSDASRASTGPEVPSGANPEGAIAADIGFEKYN